MPCHIKDKQATRCVIWWNPGDITLIRLCCVAHLYVLFFMHRNKQVDSYFNQSTYIKI